MKAEDWLYEAHSLGIRDEIFNEVKKIRQDSPNMEFNDIYETAFNRVKKRGI